MTPPIDTPADWVEAAPRRPIEPTGGGQAVASRRVRAFVDHTATATIAAGGLATIFAILGIFVYLFVEVAPLFYSSSMASIVAAPVRTHSGAGEQAPQSIVTGVDEYLEVAYVVATNGITFWRLPSGDPLGVEVAALVDHGRVTAVARAGGKGHRFGLANDTGSVVPVGIEFQSLFTDGLRTIQPEVVVGRPFRAVQQGDRITRLAYGVRDEGPVTVAVTERGRLWLTKAQEAGGLFAFKEKADIIQTGLKPAPKAPVTALLLDSLGETVLIASQAGRMYYWDIQEAESPRLMGTYQATREGDFVTALSYLIGDRSLIVGTSAGEVSAWMLMLDPDRGSDPRLEKVREFARHEGAVTVISPSQRDKGFLTADATGQIFVHYLTSGQTLVEVHASTAPIEGLMFSPKANGAVAVDGQGRLSAYTIENEHPEATLKTLFRPVLYEGYDEEQYIWQSSSGSDEFEPKFGMWPLIFGTLKGTLYAMLLATPLALLGAIYTAMFMSPTLRAVVKPAVEIMAALPTVVLGFLAGLWFAPLLEEIFPGVAAAFWVVPAAIVVTCVAWQGLPPWFHRQSGSLLELAVFMSVIAGSVYLCLAMSHRIEDWMFGGDYKQFLQSVFGTAYDQRNALVIAFAMGIAVIPTIFSISEDSISNVPRHLIAGSLAMGATLWQTLWRLVLVSASPGLFSALMIGLGRAVGETMIVLMATGNTPIMEMNLFNGFRTLSANIAVEMPEAPHGGTLYRLLFLSGLILFIFTSIVNTIAEVVRQRLRQRYSQF